MSVTVPIKPKDKFGISKSQPEFGSSASLASKDFPSELAFLRELEIQGRLIHETADGATITITPPTGTTFFFHSANATANGTGGGNVGLVNDGIQIEQINVDTGQVVQFVTKMASLVGDGIKTFTLNGGMNIKTNLFGWNENTPKP